MSVNTKNVDLTTLYIEGTINNVIRSAVVGAAIGGAANFYGAAQTTATVAKLAAPTIAAFTAYPILTTIGFSALIVGLPFLRSNVLPPQISRLLQPPAWSSIAGAIAGAAAGAFAVGQFPGAAQIAFTAVSYVAGAVVSAPYLSTLLLVACVASQYNIENKEEKLEGFKAVTASAFPAAVLFATTHPFYLIAGVVGTVVAISLTD